MGIKAKKDKKAEPKYNCTCCLYAEICKKKRDHKPGVLRDRKDCPNYPYRD